MNDTRPIPRIVSSWPPRAIQGLEATWIFCPWLEGLPRRSSLWIASLPIHDANAVLLDAIASPSFRSASLKPEFAGVCLVDPFRQIPHLFSALVDAGISGVVNLPTTGTFRGSMARALEDLGTGVNRELAMLALARDYGLRIGGAAMTVETGAKMIETGCEFVLNPGKGATDSEIQSVMFAGGRSAGEAVVGVEES